MDGGGPRPAPPRSPHEYGHPGRSAPARLGVLPPEVAIAALLLLTLRIDEGRKGGFMQRGRSPVSLADLVVAGLLRPGQRLSFRNKDAIVAEVTATGGIRIGADEYPSPSTAARAVTGGTATNGWLAWCVEQDDRSVRLAELRDQLLLR